MNDQDLYVVVVVMANPEVVMTVIVFVRANGRLLFSEAVSEWVCSSLVLPGIKAKIKAKTKTIGMIRFCI